MARKSVELPTGIEIRGESIRIRFSWNGKRCSETVAFTPSKAGIASAARLRDQVVSLIKLGAFTEAKYAELFPNSSAVAAVAVQADETFGMYAQTWLDSRSITEGTRKNYKSCLNTWWMPKLATTPISQIRAPMLRKLLAELPWTSDGVKSNAMNKLSTILASAVSDGLLPDNPMECMEQPRRAKKIPDPFTQAEADQIIGRFYTTSHWPSQIYGAYFEFAFYTGMRPSEILALRWEDINLEKRVAHVHKVMALGEIHHRTKTGKSRHVLLNDRAIKALAFAEEYATKRIAGEGAVKKLPYCFPPSKHSEHVKDTSDLHRHWRKHLAELGIRYRPPYNARHTYATICLMAGQTPAFIAKQLGHSVEILLSTYALWLSSENDRLEMEKLKLAPNMPQAA